MLKQLWYDVVCYYRIFCVLLCVITLYSQSEEAEYFYIYLQEIPVTVAAEVSDLNNRSATPAVGHKGPETPDDEDEGVGEEGDHDDEYRRQLEEVDRHC
jgi:hypothetical protein